MIQKLINIGIGMMSIAVNINNSLVKNVSRCLSVKVYITAISHIML